jgi:hypothetical protein
MRGIFRGEKKWRTLSCGRESEEKDNAETQGTLGKRREEGCCARLRQRSASEGGPYNCEEGFEEASFSHFLEFEVADYHFEAVAGAEALG